MTEEITKQKKDSTTLAFYGSLRKGMYNNRYFEKNLTLIKQGVTITGFKLFSLGSYPCAIKTNIDTDKLVVDLFEVDKQANYSIDRMEKGAGYTLEVIEIDGEIFGIYTYEQSALARLSERQVPSGDWVNFLQIDNEKPKL